MLKSIIIKINVSHTEVHRPSNFTVIHGFDIEDNILSIEQSYRKMPLSFSNISQSYSSQKKTAEDCDDQIINYAHTFICRPIENSHYIAEHSP